MLRCGGFYSILLYILLTKRSVAHAILAQSDFLGAMSEPLLNIDQTTAPRRPRRLVKKSTSLSPSGKLPLWALLVGISVLILVLAPFILTLYCSVNGSLFIAQDRRQSGLYGCDATGQVFVRRAGINSLSRQYAFAITLGFGRFGFGLAKAIDVCWDLLVGRGGQALLAISTYRIFRRTMLTKRGVCILSYDKFIALTYAPDTVYALNTYLRDLRRASSSKSRAYGPSVALIICTAYILVFPTWTSAMTGYQAYTIPYIASSSSDERLTRMNELEPCDWILGHNYTMAIERFCMVKNSSIDTWSSRPSTIDVTQPSCKS